MKDITIQFEGFSPSTYVETYVKEIVEEIRKEAPTLASVRATIHRAGKDFRGMVRIKSRAGEFFASASARRVHDLGHKLIYRIRRQLGKWKSTRFTRETIRQLGSTAVFVVGIMALTAIGLHTSL